MVGAQLRGLDIQTFEILNPGQIVDYCLEYNETVLGKEEMEEGGVREATQMDYDLF